MPRYAYERLTALDNSFLLLEKPNAYMHVASTFVFELGPLRRPEGGIDMDLVRSATEALLPRIPRYRQKLKYIPLENQPVWVDDDRFNLDYHLRHTALPKPGSIAQLKALSARIMQQHLDRSRPLWEMWLVEGLEGDRFALISKVHHCMIDGVSGVDLMNAQLKTTPDREIPETLPYFPRPAPSGLELMRHELLRRAALPFAAIRDVRHFMREADDSRRELAVRLRAVAETLGTTLRRASDTPLNRPIGPHRRFDWMAMEVSEIKEVRRALGGSLNDVVLTVVTGAVRSFLERRGVSPRGLDFRIMAPVSVRSADQRGQLGNRVSAWMIDLPVSLPDPRQQLERIAARTRELKESKQAVGADVLTAAAEWTPSTLLALGARNATRLLPFNMVVTNVPGPQVPMYLLGALMTEAYPHVPLMDRLGLGIALLSYNGRIGWGFNADYDVVPDLSAFVGDVQAAFRALRAAAAPIAARTEKAEKPPAPPRAPKANGRPRPGVGPH
ncbi:MAG TPA: wax ester/triacylglycerol synthase family O-acyltransferase [Myxococcota bacterium]|nr:wax ester/triacylglycerol synthase family O-acyltransferase [Myxococcota bacterium]